SVVIHRRGRPKLPLAALLLVLAAMRPWPDRCSRRWLLPAFPCRHQPVEVRRRPIRPIGLVIPPRKIQHRAAHAIILVPQLRPIPPPPPRENPPATGNKTAPPLSDPAVSSAAEILRCAHVPLSTSCPPPGTSSAPAGSFSSAHPAQCSSTSIPTTNHRTI